MNPLILGSVFELGKDLIDRFIPDKSEAARVEAEFLRMAAQGELQQVIAQLEINAKEAQHASIFVAGWRPFFGWAGGFGFVYATMGQPLLAWISAMNGWAAPPTLNLDLLWVVVTGMLGIGGLRTFEKSKGISK
jgi:Holin of 3TMs, for gene-transfer release